MQEQKVVEEPSKDVFPEEQEYLDKIEANGKDLEARFAYAKWLFETALRNEEAVEECMTIMT